ncbi:MAG: 2-amino-4-hydroxy-6-hydroxymethyldihydropteridine diphosphokinase [Methylobacteriaceae bacterium]|nr:2-amino-4-hydroxy-6-hydroxymethyldihydropteridine diphosphokinase [Methylobacteriaceae bacterium]
MAELALGFGANAGDPAAAIEGAMGRLQHDGLRLLARSSLYRTPPWGPVAQPEFLNVCALFATTIRPRELLPRVKALETEFGRVPGPRWGPRALDVDILWWSEGTIDEPDLTVPHPRLHERAFVLVPLAEIAPDLVIGDRRVGDLAAAIDRTGIVRLAAGGAPGSAPGATSLAQDSNLTEQP